MALYLISYDIIDTNAREYDQLWERLRQLGAVKILYSEWLLVEATGAANKIYREIAPLTAISDRLLIHEVTKDAQWDKLLTSNDVFQELLTRARS